MEQTVVSAPGLQILDAPVPQEGGTASGSLEAVGHRGARAGHRSAKDLSRQHPGALGGLRSSPSADGGTVGGSADGVVSYSSLLQRTVEQQR